MTANALYAGTIRHRRFAEASNEFEHRITLAYVDLDDAPAGRLVRFRPDDYLSADAVRERTGTSGRVRVLTTLRSFGVSFNPVSFYYCFEGDDLAAVLAEVTNTPWGERQSYVVRGDGLVIRGEVDKRLHVSPFMPMDQRYSWSLTPPGRTLSVHIESREGGEKAFDATLSLTRRPLTQRGLAATAGTSLRVLALIYGHALGLKLKGARVHPHPQEAA